MRAQLQPTRSEVEMKEDVSEQLITPVRPYLIKTLSSLMSKLNTASM